MATRVGTRLATALAAAIACLGMQVTAAGANQPDGGLIRTPDGSVYRIVGGAPLWISTCAYTNGCANYESVNDTSGYPQYPRDGAMAGGFSDGGIYRFAGGAPLPIDPCGSCGAVIIDDRTLKLDGTATAALPHMADEPADGTFLTTGSAVYRVAGGAAVALTDCSVLSGCGGAVHIDPSTIASLGDGRLRGVPKDGTVLHGVPSNTLWEIDGGYRRQTFIPTTGIDVDDGAIARIPTAPPSTIAVPVPAFAPQVKFGYRVRGSRTRFTSLTVSSLPAGAYVGITCNKRGCPFKSHIYRPKKGKVNTPPSLRRRYLRAGTTLTVAAKAANGTVKVVSFRTRKGKGPVRKIRCAAAGAKLAAC